MESVPGQRLTYSRALPRSSCGRTGCACSLPLSERFVLWALRQWQQDRALPTQGSALYGGFKVAGVLDALPDFAIAMDAFFFGARRTMRVHLPSCSQVSSDEAMIDGLNTPGRRSTVWRPKPQPEPRRHDGVRSRRQVQNPG